MPSSYSQHHCSLVCPGASGQHISGTSSSGSETHAEGDIKKLLPTCRKLAGGARVRFDVSRCRGVLCSARLLAGLDRAGRFYLVVLAWGQRTIFVRSYSASEDWLWSSIQPLLNRVHYRQYCGSFIVVYDVLYRSRLRHCKYRQYALAASWIISLPFPGASGLLRLARYIVSTFSPAGRRSIEDSYCTDGIHPHSSRS